MARRDDVEDALRASWDADHLAVYADELQTCGDPRGELIAIELGVGAGQLVELEARRTALLQQLLGKHAAHPAIRCVHGFLRIGADINVAELDAVLCGPLGPYVRELAIDGDGPRIGAILRTLCLAARPWLERLALRQSTWGDGNVPRAICDSVVRVTPNLVELEVTGRRLLPAFPHPRVERARISGINAILSLVTSGQACLPGATSLDLQFPTGGYPEPRWDRARTLLPSQLPALRRLDLSRNASRSTDAEWRQLDFFRVVRTLPVAPQLEWLRLPKILDDDDLANTQYALDRMPELRALEVLECARTRLLVHPRAKLGRPGDR